MDWVPVCSLKEFRELFSSVYGEISEWCDPHETRVQAGRRLLESGDLPSARLSLLTIPARL
jgi:hypothetical protein